MISLISLRGVSSGHFLPGVGVNVTKNTCRGCRVKDVLWIFNRGIFWYSYHKSVYGPDSIQEKVNRVDASRSVYCKDTPFPRELVPGDRVPNSDVPHACMCGVICARWETGEFFNLKVNTTKAQRVVWHLINQKKF